jgi:predicted SPOUT superfamily RNA methylase MTH1
VQGQRRYAHRRRRKTAIRMGTEVGTSEARQKRKEEGRLRKKQMIAESGGVRPRVAIAPESSNGTTTSRKKPKLDAKGPPKQQRKEGNYGTKGTTTSPVTHHPGALSSSSPATKNGTTLNPATFQRPFHSSSLSSSSANNNRFGRVMEVVPCRNKPRYSTLTIAIPGSILSNCQTRELRTLMIGQIARAATIYHVDEIVVFDDKLGRNQSSSTGWRRPRNNTNNSNDRSHQQTTESLSKTPECEEDDKKEEPSSEATSPPQQQQQQHPRSDPQTFMARLLQYCECPQYLRRHFFPMHPDLQFAGILAPIDAPHHVREGDRTPYREGVVLETKSTTPGTSLVNCGVRSRPVEYVKQKNIFWRQDTYCCALGSLFFTINPLLFLFFRRFCTNKTLQD